MRFSRGLRFRSGGSGDEMALQYWQAKGEARQRFLTFPMVIMAIPLARCLCAIRTTQAQPVERLSARKLVCSRSTKPMDGEWDERDMVGFARLMAALVMKSPQ